MSLVERFMTIWNDNYYQSTKDRIRLFAEYIESHYIKREDVARDYVRVKESAPCSEVEAGKTRNIYEEYKNITGELFGKKERDWDISNEAHVAEIKRLKEIEKKWINYEKECEEYDRMLEEMERIKNKSCEHEVCEHEWIYEMIGGFPGHEHTYITGNPKCKKCGIDKPCKDCPDKSEMQKKIQELASMIYSLGYKEDK